MSQCTKYEDIGQLAVHAPDVVGVPLVVRQAGSWSALPVLLAHQLHRPIGLFMQVLNSTLFLTQCVPQSTV